MSMEISSNYKDYKNEYLERAQTEQDKVKRTSQEQRAEDKSEGVPILKDEYISSEKSGSKPTAGEQDTRPLTDIHGPDCVSQCNGVVQRTENTGHKNDEKDQQNELRQGTGGRELML